MSANKAEEPKVDKSHLYKEKEKKRIKDLQDCLDKGEKE